MQTSGWPGILRGGVNHWCKSRPAVAQQQYCRGGRKALHLLTASGRNTKLIQETSEARRSRGALSWRLTDLARLLRPLARARSSATTMNWRLAGSPVLATCSPASSNDVLSGCMACRVRHQTPVIWTPAEQSSCSMTIRQAWQDSGSKKSSLPAQGTPHNRAQQQSSIPAAE